MLKRIGGTVQGLGWTDGEVASDINGSLYKGWNPIDKFVFKDNMGGWSGAPNQDVSQESAPALVCFCTPLHIWHMPPAPYFYRLIGTRRVTWRISLWPLVLHMAFLVPTLGWVDPGSLETKILPNILERVSRC